MTVLAYLRGFSNQIGNAIKGAFDTPNSINLTAAGTTQATSLPLPRDFNVFTTVAAGSGAQLPPGVDQVVSTQNTASGAQNTNGIIEQGDSIKVINRGANALLIYPQLGGTVQGGAANAGFSVAANKVAVFDYVGAGNWVANLSA